jgi:PAS domain S-box-containing protein
MANSLDTSDACLQTTAESAAHAFECQDDLTALRRSEVLFESLYETSGDAIMVWRADRTLLMANPAAVALFGCKDESELASVLPQGVSPEYQPDGTRSVEKARQLTDAALRGESQSFEWKYLLRDDRPLDATVLMTRVDFEGESYLQVIVHDVTKEKQTADLLRASERSYRLLVQSVGAGITLMDADYTIVSINDAQCRMFHKRPEDFHGKKCYREFEKRNAPCSHCPGTRAMATGQRASVETRGIRDDGTSFVARVSACPVFDQYDKVTGFIELVEDVTEYRKAQDALARQNKRTSEYAAQLAETNERLENEIDERRRLETALRENQRKLKAVLDQTYEYIGVLSLDGVVTEANRAALTLAGVEEPSVLGEPFWATPWWRHSPELQQELRQWIAEAARGNFVRKEVTHLDAQGEIRDVDLSLTPVRDEAGGIAFLIVEGRDMTDRKRMENDLRKAKGDAEAATQAKSDFLANMSHEIRTPMTAILGYADLLAEESIGRTAREYVEVIKRNSEHLVGVVNDILNLSKIEGGKVQVEPTRCSPIQLVAEVMSLMRVRGDAKHVKLQADLTNTLPETILTDPLRLRQILVNLVGNAIKFTDKGSVRLVARLASQGDHPLLCFDVVDTGIGIGEECVAKLFSPFAQVDGSSTRKFGGTGLGLYISKRLAEALGGEITVTSTLGKGSVFSLTVDPGPLDGIRTTRDVQEALFDYLPTTTAAPQVKPQLRGRILLAEDGEDNQRLISFVLTRAGAEVVTVENGQLAVDEALKAQSEGRPFDVILMDMQMPVLDGYAATGQLRSQGYSGAIIALTAHAMAEDRQRCVDAGCDDYVSKPIDRPKLVSVVAHWESLAREAIDTGMPAAADSNGHADGCPRSAEQTD